MPLEIQIYDGANPTNMLAVLDGAANTQWTDLLNDVGTGTTDLSFYDAKAIASLTQKGNLVKICLAYPSSIATGSQPGTPVPVFGFFNTAPKLVSDEAEKAVWTLAGESVLNYTKLAAVYPAGWTGNGTYATTRSFGSTATPTTWGAILKTLIDEAQGGTYRGAIPALTYDFSATTDSAGNAWTANVVLTIGALGRTSILDIIKKFVSLGMGVYMDPNLGLHVYTSGAYGTNLTSSVVFRYGAHIAGPVENLGSMPTTVALVEGVAGAFVEAKDTALVSSGYYGRRETGLDYSQVSGDTTQMTMAGNQQIALTELGAQAITVPLTHGNSADGFYEPYASYKPGDTIALDVPGSYSMSPFAIAALTCKQTAANDYEPSVNLGAVVISGPEALGLAVRQMITSVTGSTSGIGASLAGFLTLGNPKGFPMGPSFPSNPSDKMWWFRPDYGTAWYYVAGLGAWIQASETIRPMTPRVLAPYTASTILAGMWASTNATPAETYLDSLKASVYVDGTNNGSNYWTVTLSKGTGGGYTSIGSIDTSAIAGSQFLPIGPLAINNYMAAGYYFLKVDLTKTGSPGNLYLAADLWSREIKHS
jgi:hypothetical protein